MSDFRLGETSIFFLVNPLETRATSFVTKFIIHHPPLDTAPVPPRLILLE